MKNPNQNTSSGYSENLGTKLLKELTNEGLYVFTIDEAREITKDLGMSDQYLKLLLYRLEKSEWIIRLRRGLYATTGGLPGSTHLHPFVIATNLVEPSAISHLSALNFHELIEQIPNIVTVTTTKSVVTPSMRRGEKIRTRHRWKVQGVICEFVKVEAKFFFGIEEIWIDQHFQISITDKERTILDGFAAPQMFGGMGEVLGILQENISKLELRKLVDYALKYGKDSVIKRLGWTLDQTGVSKEVWRPLQEIPVTSYRILDPAGVKKGKCDKKWMIRNNL